MRHAMIAAAAMALIGTVAVTVTGSARERDRPLAANPSAFIAAEIAFSRLAQGKGQWTAFRATAAPEAVMFVPQRVKARDWLKSQKDPAQAVKWQPHAVYASCDGNAGVTTGAWQKGPAHGYFTTVWLRDPKKGKIAWILDHGDALAAPREAPDFIASKQAKCGTRPGVSLDGGIEGEDRATGLSPDQTLSWTSVVSPDGARRITIRLWDGTAMQPVIDDQVAAAAPVPTPRP